MTKQKASNIGWSFIGVIAIIAIMVIGINTLNLNQPQQGPGNCNTGWVAKDESAPFKYDGNDIITKVIVKSGQGCFVFLRDGNNGCYAVNGIGTTSVTARLVGEESPQCQAISHVEFYAGDPMPSPTNTATATDGVITRNTPTATNATPFKFWTFTPSPTYPPPHTPTPPTQTPTDTQTPTQTSTHEVTQTPTHPRGRTPTPQPRLPETGFLELGDDTPWDLYFAGTLFVLLTALLLRRRWIVKKKLDNKE